MEKLQELLQEVLEQEETLLKELTNADGDSFKYEESSKIKGLYVYHDSKDNQYFVRVLYQHTNNPHFEMKVGWFEDNNKSKPKYDPQLPPNSTAVDNLKRRNTVSKIYRDEVLKFFKSKSQLSKILKIKPISHSRYIFSERMVKQNTPSGFEVEYENSSRERTGTISIKIKN